jgi:RND family efflux transporter MFP subunit
MKRIELTAALLWASGWLAACGEPPATAPAGPASAASSASYVASAKGRIDIEGGLVRLAAQREGVIEQVLAEEGEQVKPGQVLAVLADEGPRRAAQLARAETEQARRQLRPLRARLSAAQREAERLRPLAQDDRVPRQELDAADDGVVQLRAELQAASANVVVFEQRERVADYELEQRRVRAPLAGTIVRRQARPGDGVSISTVTPLFLFAPESPLIVRAELEERWLQNVQAGQRAEVTLEADEQQRFKARVLRLGTVVGNRTAGDDPAERQDARVVECVLALEAQTLRIGQRVIVRFAKAGT